MSLSRASGPTRMQQPKARGLYLNLAVKDLPRSRAFFEELGFDFNEQFCNEQAGAMVINETTGVMLLVEPFFATFTRKPLCDTSTHTEALVAITCDTREEVDSLVERALTLGATVAIEPVDRGVMYSRSFYDLDHHHWEVLWMDPAAFSPN